jgi:hypothetical protein
VPRDDRPCAQVIFEVELIDVDPTIAGGVNVGERFDIELAEGRYPTVVTEAGRLGSIASGVLSRLVQCLREGVQFDAEILEVDLPLVKVRVSPR